MSELSHRKKALLLALSDLGIPKLPTSQKCDGANLDEPWNCINEYFSDGRGEPTEIAGSICGFLRRQNLDQVLKSHGIKRNFYMRQHDEDERYLSYINGEAIWPWESAATLANILKAEIEARKQQLAVICEAECDTSEAWNYRLETMKSMFLSGNTTVSIEEISRLLSDRRTRNQLFVAEMTKLGYLPQISLRWIETAPREVVQYIEDGLGSLDDAVRDAVQTIQHTMRDKELTSALASVDQSESYILRNDARCEDFQRGLLGLTTAQEVVEHAKANYDGRKQRLQGLFSMPSVYQSRNYLEGRCSWDELLNARARTDRQKLVNAGFEAAFPYSSFTLEEDPRIYKYVQSGEGFRDSDALVAVFVAERDLRGAKVTSFFAASKTPEPRDEQDHGWHAVLQFVNSAKGDLDAILERTQLALLGEYTTKDLKQLCAELSSSSNEFETVLAQAVSSRNEREQLLEAKFIENGLPHSLHQAIVSASRKNKMSYQYSSHLPKYLRSNIDLTLYLRAFIMGGVECDVHAEINLSHIVSMIRYQYLLAELRLHGLPEKAHICKRDDCAYRETCCSRPDSLLGMSVNIILRDKLSDNMTLFPPSPHLSDEICGILLENMFKGDPRCIAYVHGLRAWDDAEPIVAALLVERSERRLSLERVLPKATRERCDEPQCDAFIDSAVGTAEAVVQQILLRRHRRQELDDELRRRNVSSDGSDRGPWCLKRGEKRWLGEDHDYVVRGAGNLIDAAVSYECAHKKQSRQGALELALKSRGLAVTKTLLGDNRCTAYLIDNVGTPENISATLLEERRLRLTDLKQVLTMIGFPDLGMTSVFYSDGQYGDYGCYDDGYECYLPSWGSEESSAKKRFDFVEHAEGSAGSVAETMAEFYRGSALLRELRARGCPAWVTLPSHPDALLEWAGENEPCCNFVAGRLAGMTATSFVQGLVAGKPLQQGIAGKLLQTGL